MKNHTRLFPLALAIVTTSVSASQPVVGTGDFELQYGGAIKTEAPEVYAEIPRSTIDIAGSLIHKKDEATHVDSVYVWNIDELAGETLLRTYQTGTENSSPLDSEVYIAGTHIELGDTAIQHDLEVSATGGDGEVGILQWKTWGARLSLLTAA